MRCAGFEWATIALVSVLAATVSCGARDTLSIPPPDGGSGPATPEPTTSAEPTASATFAMTGTGLDVNSITVLPGAQVTFLNNDTVAHDIRSDVNGTTVQCPELNLGTALQVNKSTTVTMANHPETCGFYDAIHPGDDAFRGTIHVEAGSAGNVDAGSAGDGG
jgi:plastocyanin